MRLATIRLGDTTTAARIDGDAAIELPYADVGELLADPRWRDAAAGGTTPAYRLADVELAPVVPAPRKIVCVGRNYLAHIRELGNEPPSHPTLFAKFASALVGARDPIVLPRASSSMDWEAELAVVIGSPVRHADRDEAAAAIAGFTVLNDLSARDFQRRTTQWLQGKTFERTTPFGPVLVTPDELGGASPDLALRCTIDGRDVQSARTSDLLFDPPAIIVYLSQILTLEPGDVIATGTPGGVGEAYDPPLFLRAGQVVETAIEGIGATVNECVDEAP